LPLLKLKLDRERNIDVVRIVREEAPHATLIVDANQAWSRNLLERLLPQLHGLGVQLVEQPVPRGDDQSLAGLTSPIPLAADESCTDRRSLAALRDRYQLINIKLDKSGGLTEALALAHAATAAGFKLMVGNMCGTSLGMAPAFLIAQRCAYSDLDGPLLQNADREHAIHYNNGVMSAPDPRLWG
jgi:L-alanine-DL-glutamate epimerase-like enolase superfamily enzyme